jgi:hypothetical protein
VADFWIILKEIFVKVKVIDVERKLPMATKFGERLLFAILPGV